jgi:hypothetical protein
METKAGEAIKDIITGRCCLCRMQTSFIQHRKHAWKSSEMNSKLDDSDDDGEDGNGAI